MSPACPRCRSGSSASTTCGQTKLQCASAIVHAMAVTKHLRLCGTRPCARNRRKTRRQTKIHGTKETETQRGSIGKGGAINEIPAPPPVAAMSEVDARPYRLQGVARLVRGAGSCPGHRAESNACVHLLWSVARKQAPAALRHQAVRTQLPKHTQLSVAPGLS